MAGGKRASMREGPLADLFRSTGGAESTGQSSEAAPSPDESQISLGDLEAEQQATATPFSSPAPVERESTVSPPERLRTVFSIDPASTAGPIEEQSPTASASPLGSSSESVVGTTQGPVIRVVGVGGAGVNAVDRMVEAEVEGVEFIAINTDVQSLNQSAAEVKLSIGGSVTKGLGSGADPAVGRNAAVEEYDRIKGLLKGSDMVFVAAGAGGGTGTGAAPIVARIAREAGALTVGIITKPFGFEGSRRGKQAEDGVADLAEEVDTLIVVPNDRLLSVLDKQTSMVDAFRFADDVLRQGVQGISDLVTLPGIVNLDFADVRTVMTDAGNALLGIGMGTGEHRAIDAANQAISSPLLETSMAGARSILLSVTGGPDMSLWEVNEAARAVAEAAHPDANTIFGAAVDSKLGDQVWVTVVATRYREQPVRKTSRLEEPKRASEVRIRRATERPSVSRALDRPSTKSSEEGSRGRASRLEVSDLNVPEFVPRG